VLAPGILDEPAIERDGQDTITLALYYSFF
jgi:hypothetical protein